MKDLFIIKTYANSVVDLIPVEKYEDCLNDLSILKKAFENQPELIEILHTRLVSKKKKEDICHELTSKLNFPQLWQKLIFLLIHHDRLKKVTGILTKVENNIYQKLDTIVVNLKLARKQDKSTEKEILNYLAGVFGKNIKADISYDKSILGGFYAETDNMIVDGSLRNNLNKFVNSIQNKK